MREEPSIEDKIAALPDEGEVMGFGAHLKTDGRMTPRYENLLAMWLDAVRKAKGWK